MTPLSTSQDTKTATFASGSDKKCSVPYVNCKQIRERWLRAALLKAPAKARILARFVKYIQPEESGCWLWTGSLMGPKGWRYGQFAVAHNENVGAHRFSYEIANGPIPNGLFICHRCDNPRCVNPRHLFTGTQTDNLRDAAAKGRFPKFRKPRKLTADDVREARMLRQQGWRLKKLAFRYGVSEACMSLICSGKARRRLPPVEQVEAIA